MSTIPTGWTTDPDELLEYYYWTDMPNSLKDVLRRYYGLNNAKPIWARDPIYGAVLIIFEASPGTIENYYYVWNGLASTVARFEERTQDAVRNQINTRGGGKGYLGKLNLTEILPRETQ